MVVGSFLFGATVKLNNLVHNAELPGKIRDNLSFKFILLI